MHTMMLTKSWAWAIVGIFPFITISISSWLSTFLLTTSSTSLSESSDTELTNIFLFSMNFLSLGSTEMLRLINTLRNTTLSPQYWDIPFPVSSLLISYSKEWLTFRIQEPSPFIQAHQCSHQNSKSAMSKQGYTYPSHSCSAFLSYPAGPKELDLIYCPDEYVCGNQNQ